MTRAHVRQPEAGLPTSLADDLDACFEQMVLTYQDRLYAFALSFSGNVQDAEEIAQDTFMRAYRALSGYEPDRVRALALKTWLYKIALNVARNRARGKQFQLAPLEISGEPAGWEPAASVDERPEHMLARGERRQELRALLASLPERYRAAVVLRYVQDLDYVEISRVLDQPVGTVKSNVHRGVKLLRESLAEREVGME